MSEIPVELIVAAFNEEKEADRVLKALKTAKREQLIGIQNAAVLRKDDRGKLHIKETHDMGSGKGAAFGGVAGAAIGLLAGPALVVPAAVGALIGGLAAKLRDSGFSDQRLKELGTSLIPGSSAIIAVVEHKWVAEVEELLEEEKAQIVTASLKEDIAQQLEAGHDVAYNALATQEGFAFSRLAGDDEWLEGDMIIVGEDKVVGGRFLATESGFAVVGMEADEHGLTYLEAEGTLEDEVFDDDEDYDDYDDDDYDDYDDDDFDDDDDYYDDDDDDYDDDDD